MRTLIALLFVTASLSAAVYDETDFGFDTESDNLAAMELLAATVQSGDTVNIAAGVYEMEILAHAPFPLDRSYRGAAELVGLSNFTLNAPDAIFYSTRTNNATADHTKSIFKLRSCTNVTLRLKMMGNMYGDEHLDNEIYATRGVDIWSNCSSIYVSTIATGLYGSVVIGGATTVSAPTLNSNIHVVTTNYDCKYGLIANVAFGVTATNQSIGTPDRAYASHRSVYIAGSTDVEVWSWVKDCAVRDGVHIVSSSPYITQYNYGSTNVTIHATDLGTTYDVSASRKFVKLGIVYDSLGLWQIPTTHRDITFDVNVVSDGTKWPNSQLLAFGCIGTEPRHTFTGIKLTGIWERSADIGSGMRAIYITDTDHPNGGLASADLRLENFTDNSDGSGYSIYTLNEDIPVTITGCNAVLDSPFLWANPTLHTYTDLGDCEEAPPPPPPPVQVGTKATIGNAVIGHWQ